jgi:hypothetical protein
MVIKFTINNISNERTDGVEALSVDKRSNKFTRPSRRARGSTIFELSGDQ